MALLKIFLHCLELLEFFASSLGIVTASMGFLLCLSWQTEGSLLPTTFAGLLLVLLWKDQQELEF